MITRKRLVLTTAVILALLIAGITWLLALAERFGLI